MATITNPVRLPAGEAGLVLRENRLLSRPTEYIDAEGVTFEDHHARKEAGATKLDENGIAGAPLYEGTISGSGDRWGGVLARFPGSGIAAGGTAASADITSTGTTQTITVPAGGYAQNSLVVVVAVTNNFSTTPNSVTDDQSNSYSATTSSVSIGSTILVGQVRMFVSRITTALNAGDDITVTYSGLNSQGVIVVANFTGVSTGVNTGTSTSSQDVQTTTTIGPLSPGPVPVLLVAGLGCATETFAPGSSPIYTEAVELNGTNMTGAIHYRIDTTSPTIIAMHDWHSAGESNPTGTVSIAAGSTTVTGSSTTFLADVFPRDYIRIGTEIQQVDTVTSNTVLDTVDEWETTASGSAWDLITGQRIITATTEGALYKERGFNLDAVTLKAGLSTTARPGRFVQGGKEAAANNRKLFYFNGADVVQVLSGDAATTSDITSPPVDWSSTNQPLNGVIHRDRLVAWGNRNDPSRIYLSDPDDHEDFTTPSAQSLRVASNVGERLIGGISFNGVLWLWKWPRGIFYLDDQPLNTSEWVIFTKSEAVGCAESPYAVLPIDDDVLFLAADASFHVLSAVDTLGGVKDSDLSSALGIDKWIRENVNLARLDQVTSVWYPNKKLALFGMPGTGESTNTLTLKFDFAGVDQGQPVKFSYSQRDGADAFTIFRDSDTIERPLLGESGFIYLMDQDARNKNDLGYTASYQTPHLDMSHIPNAGLEYRRKNWKALELVMDPADSGTVTVQVYVDTVLQGTLSFDATQRRERKILQVGDGYTISLAVSNSTADEDFKILSHNIWFSVGNEDFNRSV